MRRATRRVSTRVLPEPAPATMHRASDGHDTAASCDSVEVGHGPVERVPARLCATGGVGPTADTARAPVVPQELRLSVGCAGAEVVRRRSPVRRNLGRGGSRPSWPCTAGVAPTSTSPRCSTRDGRGVGPEPSSAAAGARPGRVRGHATTSRGVGIGRVRRVPGAPVRRARSAGRPGGGGRPTPSGAGWRSAWPPWFRTGSSAWCSPGSPCSTAGTGVSRPAPAYRLVRRLHRMGLVGEDRLRAMQEKYGSPDYRAAQGVMRGVFVRLLAEQYVDDMAAVGCPVELVWGERDTEVPVEVAERAVDAVPGGPVGHPARGGPSHPHRGPAASSGPSSSERPTRTSGGGERPGRGLARRPRPGPTGSTRGVSWVTVGCCVAALVPAGLRWLRVAQREHYLAGSAARFAGRWWRTTAPNGALAAVAVAAAVLSLCLARRRGGRGRGGGGRAPRPHPAGPDLTAGLDPPSAHPGRGVGCPEIVVVAVGDRPRSGRAGWRWWPLLAVPLLVDAACAVTAPVEDRLAGHFVDDAAARLALVQPDGGGHHRLLREDVDQEPRRPPGPPRPCRWWPPRPASTTGPGWPGPSTSSWPTAPRCSWPRWGPTVRARSPTCAGGARPDIAVITAIGPVHLERFGSEERIVEAKSEILTAAADVVLPVDDPRLAAVADRAAEAGKRVMRCSGVDREADVCVVRSPEGTRLTAYRPRLGAGRGRRAGRRGAAHQPGLCHRRGRRSWAWTPPSWPPGWPPSRRSTTAWPRWARRRGRPSSTTPTTPIRPGRRRRWPPWWPRRRRRPSLGRWARPPPVGGGDPGHGGARPRQREENATFGAAIAAVATDAVIVGRTNRRALLAGAGPGARSRPPDRAGGAPPQAVEWVRRPARPRRCRAVRERSAGPLPLTN